jgi:hypothetical protein
MGASRPQEVPEDPMSEMPLESPTEDVAEQRADAYPTAPRAGSNRSADEAFEADPADARDQADEVPLDEDDYQ